MQCYKERLDKFREKTQKEFQVDPNEILKVDLNYKSKVQISATKNITIFYSGWKLLNSIIITLEWYVRG